MTRKRKEYATRANLITRFIARNYNQELAGQTKLKHYDKTEFISCALCSKTELKLHRHRIRPGAEYTDDNTIIVCVSCHKLIHRIYKETNAQDEEQFRLAILLAKLEVS